MSDIQIIKGSTYRDTLRWATDECRFVAATLVPGAPVRFTALAHGIPDGWPLVYVEGARDIDANKPQGVRVVDVDTLELPCMNGVKFKAGDVVLRVRAPVELAGYQARMQIRDKVNGVVLLEMTSAAPAGQPRIVVDDTTKTIVREIPASVTEALEWKRGVFDLEMFSGDYVVKIDSGAVSVREEVTK